MPELEKPVSIPLRVTEIRIKTPLTAETRISKKQAQEFRIKEILDKRICDLGLDLESSALHKSVQQLYRELERKKILKFRPLCYLSDEWGCPSGEPVIGIPFYLASPDLSVLEKDLNDLEDSREIMMYLRHEAGHAFNYAYGFTARRSGSRCLDRSGVLIAITIVQCLFPGTTCVILRAGTRKNIPMKTLRKLLRYGLRPAQAGANATESGRP